MRMSLVLECSLLAAFYVLLAKACQMMAIPPGNISPLWLPSALILTATLVRGPKIWPGIFIGAFLGNISAYFTGESTRIIILDFFSAACNGAGDVIGCLVSSYLIKKRTNTAIPLFNTQDVFIFLLGAIVAGGISALLGVPPLWLTGRLDGNGLMLAFSTWFIGDTVSIMVFAPMLLVLTKETKNIQKQNKSNILFSISVFFLLGVVSIAMANEPIEIALLLLAPVLILVILNINERVSYFFLSGLCVIAIIKAMTGNPAIPIDGILELQVFLAIIAMTILFTQGLVIERSRATEALAKLQGELISRVENQEEMLLQRESDIENALAFTNTVIWKYDINTSAIVWSDTVEKLFGLAEGHFQNNLEYLKSIVHPEDRPELLKSIKDSIKQNCSHDHTFRIRTSEGNINWIHGYWGTQKDKNNNPIYLTGLIRNITQEYETQKTLKKALHELQLAVKTARLGIWRFFLSTGKLEWNDELFKIYDVSREAFEQNIDCWKEKVFKDDLTYAEQRFEEIMKGVCVYDVEFRILRGDNEIRYIQASGAPIFDAKGNIEELVGINLDVTHIRQREQEIAEAASVFENTIEGIVMTDLEGVIQQVNPAFESITGYLREEVVGKTCRVLKSEKHDKDFYIEMWQSLTRFGQWKGEIYNKRKNGEIYPELLTISTSRNENNSALGFVAVFSDISVLKESQARLNFLAHHDPLTQLPNRLLLDGRLKQSIRHAACQNTKLALVFIDIDHFKDINDSFGHITGDALLKNLAVRFKEHLRESDTASRISGDEFVILFEKVQSREDIKSILKKLIHAAKAPFILHGREVRITLSMGAAIFPDDATEPQTLMSHADAAMYAAKESGRNTYRFYTKSLTQASIDQVTITNALQQSIENQEFSIVLQPQANVSNFKITGLEVLLRWQHPVLGTVPPDSFLHIAEQAGLLRDIDMWVLKKSLSIGKHLLDEGINFGRLAVNLSSSQLSDNNFSMKVESLMKNVGMPAMNLELEITESFIMRGPDSCIGNLIHLRNMGIQISIDDFGTGYSSLSYLKQLPIDKVKIDRSFIQDIPNDIDNMAITEAIISMGRALNLEVIAEGVETQAQLDFIHQCQCDQAQGFLISKPLSLSELIKYMKQHQRAESAKDNEVLVY